jgi:hypothetical protein
LIGGAIGSLAFNTYVIAQSLSGRKASYYAGLDGLGRILAGNATAFGTGCAIGSLRGGVKPRVDPSASSANLSKGSTLPQNLRQQLAVKQAVSNPTAGIPMNNIKMNDPRWPAAQGWIKMRQSIDPGGRQGPINVHYLYNTITKMVADPKIKF